MSFSSRIPNAIPLGDAMTIGANVDIYNSGNMSFKEMMQAGLQEEEQQQPAGQTPTPTEDTKPEVKITQETDSEGRALFLCFKCLRLLVKNL